VLCRIRGFTQVIKNLAIFVKTTDMTPEKYINPFTDFGFKKIFGEEANKDLLIDFLNSFFDESQQIESLEYIKSEKLGNAAADRKAIYDLYCKTKNEERFIVEIQKAKQDFFKDRSVYYASFPIQEQALKGDWNYRLMPVYTVGILNFVFADHKNERDTLFHKVQLKDQEGKVFYDKLTFIYLELPKFNKTIEELETQFDKWLYVFKYLPLLDELPNKFKDKIFQKLFKVAEIAKFSRDERSDYENSLKYLRDLGNVIDTAKREGEQIGLEKGEQIGLEKGEQAAKKKAIIQALKTGLLTIKQITEIFEVTTKEALMIQLEANL
jgi:predicted transposase/invertase (TIGR01784 family)